MLSLPPSPDLERVCRGLAMLDALLSEDWEMRYFSFNGDWGDGDRMASMRSGSGDEWFILFHEHEVFLKVFFHEIPRADPAEIYAGCPSTLTPQLTEPAFSMGDVTAGGFFTPASGWTLRGEEDALRELTILQGDPQEYRDYAADYFEVDLPLDGIAHVLAGKPVDEALLTALASERELDELEDDRAEIGY